MTAEAPTRHGITVDPLGVGPGTGGLFEDLRARCRPAITQKWMSHTPGHFGLPAAKVVMNHRDMTPLVGPRYGVGLPVVRPWSAIWRQYPRAVQTRSGQGDLAVP